MALIVPPGFSDIAIELRASGDPDPWYVTFGVDSSDAAGDLVVIGDVCNSAWTAVMQQISPIVSFTGCKVTVGQDGPFPIRGFVPQAGGPTAGASNVDKLPSNCALLVRKTSAEGGRRGKGRFYVPGLVSDNQCDNLGVIAGASLTVWQELFSDFFDFLTDTTVGPPASLPMVVLHDSLGVTPPGDPTPVTGLQVDGVIATQRRRMR